MTDSTANSVQDIVLTRQTVDLPTELMEHFDRIKRRRGHRSFGAYVVALIQADAAGIIQTDERLIKVSTNSTHRPLSPDIVELLEQHHLETLDVLGRISDALADLGRKTGKDTRHVGPTATKAAKRKTG